VLDCKVFQGNNKFLETALVINSPGCKPSPSAQDASELVVYLPNNNIEEAPKRESVILCSGVEMWVAKTEYKIKVKKYDIVGSLPLKKIAAEQPQPIKKDALRYLDFSINDIEDSKVAVWKIPPVIQR
jgi:hypothetical protein